jgi:hypothetical protein
MVLADSSRISPVPPYSGYHTQWLIYAYGIITLFDSTFQKIQLDNHCYKWSYNPHPARRISLGSSLFARHYSGNHYYFLFLSLLRCFSSGGWLSFEWYVFNIPGCPIRKSTDITLVCSSPLLIAAYHVLHRLLDPRHPPCALNCFKKIEIVVVLPPLSMLLSVLQLNCYPICQRTSGYYCISQYI